jgi:ribonucleoside-diphosphate reductase alpha chain
MHIYYLHFAKFITFIKTSINFLDDVASLTGYPNIDINRNMLKHRPLGLGIMGLADILFKLNIPYNSGEGYTLFKNICKTLTKIAFEESINMCSDAPEIKNKNLKKSIILNKTNKAKLREILIHYGVDHKHIVRFDLTGIRNSQVSCIAPTGSISISADCSYAFEPIMGLVWSKKLVDTDEVLYFTNKIFEEEALPYIIEKSKLSKDEIIKDIVNNNGSIQKLEYIPNNIKRRFVTAHDISPLEKIDMQAAGQQYISMAISSTCNLPNSATKEDISKIYKYAYKKGLKGITIYRDGCKNNQPVRFTENKNKLKKLERPIVRYGKTIEVKTPVGLLFITINDYKDKPLEVFLTLGKGGQLNNILLDTLARSISAGLQYNIPLESYIKSFKDTTGNSFWSKIGNDHSQSHKSIIDMMATVFERHISELKSKDLSIIENNEIQQDEKDKIKINKNIKSKYEICPECFEETLNLNYGGCKSGICIECGYSACTG